MLAPLPRGLIISFRVKPSANFLLLPLLPSFLSKPSNVQQHLHFNISIPLTRLPTISVSSILILSQGTVHFRLDVAEHFQRILSSHLNVISTISHFTSLFDSASLPTVAMSSDHGEESDSGSETSGSCIYHSSGSTDADGRHSSNEDSNSVIAKPSSSSSHSSVIEETLATQLQLLRVGESDDDKSKEASTAPLFTEAVRQSDLSTGDANTPSSFSQWGLVGGDSQGLALVRKYGYSPQIDPRVFINVSAPLSVFICGSQGSGKSHSLSCLLENYLVQSVTNVLPRPLTGIVFYFDDLTSDAGGSPCEAAYLSSHSDIKVRVLCSRTNISNIKVSVNRRPTTLFACTNISLAHIRRPSECSDRDSPYQRIRLEHGKNERPHGRQQTLSWR